MSETANLYDVSNVTNEYTFSFRSGKVNLEMMNNNNKITMEVAAYITLEACIAFLALMNNLLVVIAIWKFHSLRTPTNWFVASLAVADIAVAVFAIPSAILLRLGLSIKSCDASQGYSTHGYVSRNVCFCMITFVIVLTQVSIFSLLVIAIDRYIAIHYPLRYRSLMTSLRIRVGIIAVWVMGAVIGIAPVLGWTRIGGEEKKCNCEFEAIMDMEYMVYFNFFGCVLTPLIAMGVIYVLIFRSAKIQLQKIYSDVIKIKHPKTNKLQNGDSSSISTGISSFSYSNGNCKTRSNKNFKLPPLVVTLTAPDIRSHFPTTKSVFTPENGTNGGDGEADSSLHPKMQGDREIIPMNNNQESRPSVNSLPAHESSGNTETIAGKNRYSQYLDASKKTRDVNHLRGRGTVSLADLRKSEEFIKEENSSAKLNSNGKNDGFLSVGKKPESFRNYAMSVIPRGKAYSFSACTSCQRIPGKKNNCYHIRATTLARMTDDDNSSTTSSRSTLYTSENGVWTVVKTEDTNKRHRMTYQMKRKSQLLKKEFRAARSLATVVGIFALCWLPLHILNCLTLFCPMCWQPSWMKDFAIILSHANSVINPLIYAFKLKDFRNAFTKILGSVLPSQDQSCDSQGSIRSNSRSTSKKKFSSLEKKERGSLFRSRKTRKSGNFRTKTTSGTMTNNNSNNDYINYHTVSSSTCNCFSTKYRKTTRTVSKVETEATVITSVESTSPDPTDSLAPSCDNALSSSDSNSSANSRSNEKLYEALVNSTETTL